MMLVVRLQTALKAHDTNNSSFLRSEDLSQT